MSAGPRDCGESATGVRMAPMPPAGRPGTIRSSTSGDRMMVLMALYPVGRLGRILRLFQRDDGGPR